MNEVTEDKYYMFMNSDEMAIKDINLKNPEVFDSKFTVNLKFATVFTGQETIRIASKVEAWGFHPCEIQLKQAYVSEEY